MSKSDAKSRGVELSPRSAASAVGKGSGVEVRPVSRRKSWSSGACAVALFYSVVAPTAHAAEAPWRLTEGAKVHPDYHGPVPSKSDVVFSTRSKRDDAPATAKAFGASRIEWVYTTDAAFVESLRNITPWFGGTLNSNAPLPAGTGYALDFDGKPVIAPWMKAWGTKWVTTNSPETRKVMGEQLERYLQFGARSIQFDDPSLQAFSANYAAGDFNPATMGGFKAWLASSADQRAVRDAGLADFDGDYRAYLKKHDSVSSAEDYKARYLGFASTPLWLSYIQSTVENYYSGVRKMLAGAKEGGVALSMNLSNFYDPDEKDRAYFLTRYADYLMSETDISKTPAMVTQVANARALGMGSVPSLKPLDVARNRVAIATFYALGAPPLVPWDVYTGSSNRYYGSVEEYGDLYRFASNHGPLLDGYESTAVVGVVVAVDKYRAKDTRDLLRRLTDKQIPFAFVPLGGREPLPADPRQLGHFRLLISVNDDSDYSSADLRALTKSKVDRMSLAQASDSILTGLQPFVAAPGGDKLRIYPRARPERGNKLVIHIVDEARGSVGDMAAADCSRRIGIRKSLLGDVQVRGARWVAGLSPAINVNADDSKDYEFFTLKGCPLWGALEVDLAR